MGDTEMVIERKSRKEIHREIDQIFSDEILTERLLQIVWGVQNVMKPTLVMLNNEWGLLQKTTVMSGELLRTYIHYCPSGDVRAVKGKVCELCRVQVPEAVQFMVQTLST